MNVMGIKDWSHCKQSLDYAMDPTKLCFKAVFISEVVVFVSCQLNRFLPGHN